MKAKIKIVSVPIADLKPSEYNPRKLDKATHRELTKSIKKFGLVDPIIANSAEKRKNIVIGGHQRLSIAKELNYTEVPVVYLDIPNLKKEKELNLRLNRNIGEFDMDLLKNMDLDLLLDVGFTDEDLSSMWDEVIEVEDDNFKPEEEIKKIKTTDIKEGDLFQLGRHKLICGNSTDLKVIAKLMGKDRADMFYSDPPYNIALDYNKGVGTKGKLCIRWDKS